MQTHTIRVALLVLALSMAVSAFEANKFKNCRDASFCRRQRDKAIHTTTHELDASSITSPQSNLIRFEMKNKADPNIGQLLADLYATPTGDVRLFINEKGEPMHIRYKVQDVIQPDIEVRDKPVPENGCTFEVAPATADNDGQTFTEAIVVCGGTKTENSVRLFHEPFRVDFRHRTRTVVAFNARGLFNFEYYRFKSDEKDNPTDGGWSENFQTHADSKPRGPALVASDISFVGAKHVYGIPEHATTLALKDSVGAGISSEPYRLYNLDVFEYDLDLPFGLYGSVPFMLGHSQQSSVGVLWLNAAETFVDVGANDASDAKLSSDVWTADRKDTHWMSESGVIDLHIFFGDKPADIFRNYALVTGKAQLPPLFSIAYHQCRWNYKDEADVRDVDAKFDEHDIPMDVLWLDIEHTDGKRYFTWDKNNFPTPIEMQKNLASKGRKMVTIIDPHMKRDDNYFFHKEATAQGMYIKKADGKTDYDGWCWPGSSGYLDFTNPTVREFWANMFSPNKYVGSTPSLYTWNDMNEPSVFNGPEVSMHKDAMHHEEHEHRDVHNIYGMYVHQATFEGHDRMRSENDRPFVLSRAFFAGTQRFGAIWTGDNAAKWEHLDAATPMILSIGIAGIPFAGADVGGFFGNPSPELLVRWYQAGAFQPFFRGHAHLDTDRREPWIHGDPYTGDIRNAILQRYAILPYLYTLFAEAHRDGMPVMRPLFVEFPKDGSVLTRDDSFMLGSAILVKPVVTANQDKTEVYLPGDSMTRWFDYDNYDEHQGGATITVSTPLRKIPVFLRGGTVIVRRERIRRSTAQMVADPFTLVVTLDSAKSAKGELYVDDYHTRNHLRGESVRTEYTFENGVLSAKTIQGSYEDQSLVERVVVLGLGSAPSSVTGADGTALDFTYTESNHVLVVKRPNVRAVGAWQITFA